MAVYNNLYPPVFEKNYMPSFIAQQSCNIYFSISSYNNLGEILKYVQVSIQNQRSNYSVINNTYKTLFKPIQSTTTSNLYYITILNTDIQGGFKINNYYKVQLRFILNDESSASKTLEGLITSESTEIPMSTIQNYLGYFSEWSTVCLIKPISNFSISLASWENESDEDATFYLNDVLLSGQITFEDPNETEKLLAYRILLYDANEKQLEDSKLIYKNNNEKENEFSYTLTYNFDEDGDTASTTQYILKIQIITNNLYERTESFSFILNDSTVDTLDATITATTDEQAGAAVVHIEGAQEIGSINENLIIRRTSSKTNFKRWEDVYITLPQSGKALDITWKDLTVEPGVWYKYSAYLRNAHGFKTKQIQCDDKNWVMINPEDIFLTTGQYQLKLRFDPQISNFSHVVSESLTTTLGSKYPFIRRNGNVNYRSFSLSGTISAFIDLREDLMKASYQDLYEKNILDKQKEYNKENNITLYKDYINERNFREKVLQFLYDNNVKLFRSAPQGNILVKLMNISLTPNNTLSRLIYSFSCTANEVDECTFENYNKYNIQNIGTFTYPGKVFKATYGEKMYSSLGTESSSGEHLQEYFPTTNFISTDLSAMLNNNPDAKELHSVEFLRYLKVNFSTPPYPIYFDANGIPVRNIIGQKNNANSSQNRSDYVLGHIITLIGPSFAGGQKKIVVGYDGVYELTDLDISNLETLNDESMSEEDLKNVLQIKQVLFEPNESGMISYVAVTSSAVKAQINPIKVVNSFVKGQFWGTFASGQSIYAKILKKYSNRYSYVNNDNATTTTILYTVQNFSGATIEAKPGTVIQVREYQDGSINNHVINETGLLDFYDDDTNIRDIKFLGTLLRKNNDPNPKTLLASEDEWYDTELSYYNTKEIINPMHNGVYTIIKNQDQVNNSDEGTITSDDIILIKTFIQQLYNIVEDPFTQEETNNLTTILNSSQNVWQNIITFIDTWCTRKMSTAAGAESLKYVTGSQENNLTKQYIYLQKVAKEDPSKLTDKYIYYNGSWYPFVIDDADSKYGIVYKTSYGIINYDLKVTKKTFEGVATTEGGDKG